MTNCSGRAGTFKKGDDPRRNKKGARSKDAQSFAERFANALATKGTPDELAELLWEKARRGQPWAVEMVLDRLLGKVTQPVSGAVTMDGKLVVEFVETRG